jgi:hypothetical protein
LGVLLFSTASYAITIPETPATCGPIISDTCVPIETHKSSLQVLWAWSLVRENLTFNWRRVSAQGNFSTFTMPVKFTYGAAKGLETYIVIPYVLNLASNVDKNLAGPSRERSANYGGVGDISMVGKYLLVTETEILPAVAGVFGVGVPSGHAHNLNPRFLNQDAIGSGAVTFTSGVNLFKYLKPFLVHSQVWFNAPINLFPIRNDSVRSPEFMICNVATEYPITKRWIALLEFYSTWTWTNISTPQGVQSPATLFGVLFGVEFITNEKWAVSTGTSLDLFGKSGSQKITPMFTVYYNF